MNRFKCKSLTNFGYLQQNMFYLGLTPVRNKEVCFVLVQFLNTVQTFSF